MGLVERVLARYPDAKPERDFSVAEESGVERILWWDEARLGPRPEPLELPPALEGRRVVKRRKAALEADGAFEGSLLAAMVVLAKWARREPLSAIEKSLLADVRARYGEYVQTLARVEAAASPEELDDL